ncbi:uncharacterized protein LACBIDRAFT_327595 [Laccaria bicolor S238N-H82]|uniref:Predicted protein n=1 Tax=Laccaria bicolor (strain S238N-H82 / ATCC MYA-4686) TaxID=486041 RepID=B0DC77_LACBS|nr:uncharacterized protein LACBIDRAFT_327595 [Laccaria bicolor S238N-H82]EDR07683.1 predicted protein [Laccaria bicolor S238N-H82]|eukprot:XP_001881472.1 predicted protein [Laccaria bicolor S238N-H82]
MWQDEVPQQRPKCRVRFFCSTTQTSIGHFILVTPSMNVHIHFLPASLKDRSGRLLDVLLLQVDYPHLLENGRYNDLGFHDYVYPVSRHSSQANIGSADHLISIIRLIPLSSVPGGIKSVSSRSGDLSSPSMTWRRMASVATIESLSSKDSMILRVKGQSFDQPDRIRMLRRELHMNSIIWVFLLSDGPSRAQVTARHLSAAFGSSISLLSTPNTPGRRSEARPLPENPTLGTINPRTVTFTSFGVNFLDPEIGSKRRQRAGVWVPLCPVQKLSMHSMILGQHIIPSNRKTRAVTLTCNVQGSRRREQRRAVGDDSEGRSMRQSFQVRRP